MPVTLKRNNYITKISEHACTVEGQVVTFVPSLSVGKCAHVWERHWGSLRQRAEGKDAVFCVWCCTGLATPFLAPTSTWASRHGWDQYHGNRHIPVPHVCWPEKRKGLMASSFPGLQFLRPPHTTSELGAPEISPVSSLDTEETNCVMYFYCILPFYLQA